MSTKQLGHGSKQGDPTAEGTAIRTEVSFPEYALWVPNPARFREIGHFLCDALAHAETACEQAVALGSLEKTTHWVSEVIVYARLHDAYAAYAWFLSNPRFLQRLKAWAWGETSDSVFRLVRREAKKRANRKPMMHGEEDAREAMRCAMLAACGHVAEAIDALRRGENAAEALRRAKEGAEEAAA